MKNRQPEKQQRKSGETESERKSDSRENCRKKENRKDTAELNEDDE